MGKQHISLGQQVPGKLFHPNPCGGLSCREAGVVKGAGAEESTLQQETELLCSALFLIPSPFFFA